MISKDARGFVLLSDVVPHIVQEIRYFSTFNFGAASILIDVADGQVALALLCQCCSANDAAIACQCVVLTVVEDYAARINILLYVDGGDI